MEASISENARRALAGDLYYAFTPELTAARSRCKHACNRYNDAGVVSRRQQVELWRDIVQDKSPLPSHLEDQEQDDAQLIDEPWIESPVRIDYGTNLRLGSNVYVNFNCTILDTCLVTIGSRTLLASNVSLFSATHPLDPMLRNGTRGPELGKEIHIGEDCFIGGNVTVCPGVRIGRGVTVGAGSVVTRDVPDMCVVAGNPARIIRRLDGSAFEKKIIAENGVPNETTATSSQDRTADRSADMTATHDAQGKKTAFPTEIATADGQLGSPGDNVIASSGRKPSESIQTRNEDERLMTQSEWEDEIGRQIAEKALLYGASMK